MIHPSVLIIFAAGLFLQASCVGSNLSWTSDDPEITESVPSEPDKGGQQHLAPVITMNNGLKLPSAGIGTYSLHGETCFNSVYSALKNGVRLIDTAYMYGNEEEVGRAVRQAIADGICKREDITVITKIYPGSQFSNPEPAIQDRLDKLDIGYVDIMLLHHPGANDVKAYKAMEKFRSAGGDTRKNCSMILFSPISRKNMGKPSCRSSCAGTCSGTSSRSPAQAIQLISRRITISSILNSRRRIWVGSRL